MRCRCSTLMWLWGASRAPSWWRQGVPAPSSSSSSGDVVCKWVSSHHYQPASVPRLQDQQQPAPAPGRASHGRNRLRGRQTPAAANNNLHCKPRKSLPVLAEACESREMRRA